MSYSPNSEFAYPSFFYPVIDDALRNASFRNVKVRFMHSFWDHTHDGNI